MTAITNIDMDFPAAILLRLTGVISMVFKKTFSLSPATALADRFMHTINTAINTIIGIKLPRNFPKYALLSYRLYTLSGELLTVNIRGCIAARNADTSEYSSTEPSLSEL
jgi:hypothetical protein